MQEIFVITKFEKSRAIGRPCRLLSFKNIDTYPACVEAAPPDANFQKFRIVVALFCFPSNSNYIHLNGGTGVGPLENLHGVEPSENLHIFNNKFVHAVKIIK